MKRAAVKRGQLAASEAKNAKADRGAEASAAAPSSTATAPADNKKRSVTIRLAGKEYRLRSDSTEESLQQVASYVDQSMQKIRERTDTVDSLDTALLTALNLAREVLYLRNQNAGSSGKKNAGKAAASHSGLDEIPDGRLRGLIEQIESALPSVESGRP